ncbi:hypothetical protein MHU86_7419 [Fragilaria crotonensis]|nr:hypothetical protein MHU86_7419 [Fragilaria crotonensis]
MIHIVPTSLVPTVLGSAAGHCLLGGHDSYRSDVSGPGDYVGGNMPLNQSQPMDDIGSEYDSKNGSVLLEGYGDDDGSYDDGDDDDDDDGAYDDDQSGELDDASYREDSKPTYPDDDTYDDRTMASDYDSVVKPR